jgi:hypothetical protein
MDLFRFRGWRLTFQGILQMICASNYNAELQGGQSVATSLPLSLNFLSTSGWVPTQKCEGSMHRTIKFMEDLEQLQRNRNKK